MSRHVPGFLYFVGVFQGCVAVLAILTDNDAVETKAFASGAFFIAWATYHRIMQRRAPTDGGGANHG